MDYEDEEFYDKDCRDFSQTINRLWKKLKRYEEFKIRTKNQYSLLLDPKDNENYKLLSTFHTAENMFIQIYDSFKSESLAEIVESFLYEENLMFELTEKANKETKYVYTSNLSKNEERDFMLDEVNYNIYLSNINYFEE
jgi:hypothetical protein